MNQIFHCRKRKNTLRLEITDSRPQNIVQRIHKGFCFHIFPGVNFDLIPLQPKRYFPSRSRESNRPPVVVPCLISSTHSPTSRDITNKLLQVDSENEFFCRRNSPNHPATHCAAGSVDLKLPPTPSSRPKALMALPQKIRARPAVLSSSLPSLTSCSIVARSWTSSQRCRKGPTYGCGRTCSPARGWSRGPTADSERLQRARFE